MTTNDLADDWLAAALRGDPPPSAAASGADLAERAMFHGIAGLVVAHPLLPVGAQAAVTRQATAQAMWELRHKALLHDLFAGFGAAGLAPIVFKGSALAYDLYDEPAQRARGDTDILVPESQIHSARRVLARNGLHRAAATGRAEGQEEWSAVLDGHSHAIDLHWHIAPSPVLRAGLTWADLDATARRVPRLAGGARAPGRAESLYVATLHRARHVTSPYRVAGIAHRGAARLIWAEDIARLAATMTPADWQRFTDLAERAGAGRPVLDSLDWAGRLLGEVVPPAVAERLVACGHGPVSAYLSSRSPLRRAVLDLRALPGIAARVDHGLARLLPEARLLRARTAGGPRLPLPLLHLRRWLGALFPGRS